MTKTYFFIEASCEFDRSLKLNNYDYKKVPLVFSAQNSNIYSEIKFDIKYYTSRDLLLRFIYKKLQSNQATPDSTRSIRCYILEINKMGGFRREYQIIISLLLDKATLKFRHSSFVDSIYISHISDQWRSDNA